MTWELPGLEWMRQGAGGGNDGGASGGGGAGTRMISVQPWGSGDGVHGGVVNGGPVQSCSPVLTHEQALVIADRLLVLINSQPRTPRREDLAAEIVSVVSSR